MYTIPRIGAMLLSGFAVLGATPGMANAQAKPALVRSVNVQLPPPIVTTQPYILGGVVDTARVTMTGNINTYSCTLDGGTVQGAFGSQAFQFTGNLPPGAITFICSQSDGVNTSAPGYTSVPIIPPAATPTIIVQPSVTAGTQTVNASVIANPGEGYAWSISNGMITSVGGASGLTIGGFNAITFKPGPSGTVTLSCIEQGYGGVSSAGTANVTIQ